MDTKILRNDKIVTIEQVEHDPDGIGSGYLGKIKNNTDKTLFIRYGEAREDYVDICPKSEIDFFADGGDIGIWDYIVNGNYSVNVYYMDCEYLLDKKNSVFEKIFHSFQEYEGTSPCTHITSEGKICTECNSECNIECFKKYLKECLDK